MISIGIDQSLNSTGVVTFNDDDHNILHASTINPPKNLDVFDKVIYISTTLTSIINNVPHTINHIALEGLAFHSRSSSKSTLAGVQFMIILTIRKLNLPFIIVAPTSLKKFATGKGNASKNDMIKQLPTNIVEQFDTFGFTVNETKGGVKRSKGYDDIADAYWLTQYKMLGNIDQQ